MEEATRPKCPVAVCAGCVTSNTNAKAKTQIYSENECEAKGIRFPPRIKFNQASKTREVQTKNSQREYRKQSPLCRR